ncbi:hypothetical protein ACFL4G_00770 [Thermodesulfobacteriota bacterium]
MPRHDDDFDHEKPNWRDIDRMRDRSRHASRDRDETGGAFRSKKVKEQYLRAAEKLFSGKKGVDEVDRDADELHAVYGTQKFKAAVESYLERFGLPKDWRTLLLLLEYDDSKTVGEVLEAMREQYDQRSSEEKEDFRRAVRLLAMTARDHDLRDAAEEIDDELSD